MISPEFIDSYHADSESVFNTWFLDEGRLKAFRTIRRGIQVLVQDLESGALGNDYHGSSLETVVGAIAEQKQVFAGAAHPFYWKPKLRIPDIYENQQNQQRYAVLLEAALRTTDEHVVIREMLKLSSYRIKGLGPSSANLLYFLHPSQFPPFNTAIIRGYNYLSGQSLKLGDWQAYLKMRDGILQIVKESDGSLSRDLGDVAGLCFEIGTGRMIASSLPEDARQELERRWEKETAKRHNQVVQEMAHDREHAEQQARLADLGRAWGYQVWIARNDHGRAWSGGKLGTLSLSALPPIPVPSEVRDTVELIDVLWLDQTNYDIVAAFEVEKSTSIYSGILRLYDLALSIPSCRDDLYLVAPDDREKQIVFQLCRPSLTRAGVSCPEYILFSDLAGNCSQMARFGTGLPTLKKLSKRV
ncbi:MAG: hypothetical protein ACC700_21050 [Anaerolineales bacterium]